MQFGIQRGRSLFAGFGLLVTAVAGDWPQWRGPTRDGQVQGPAWPDSLSKSNLVQLWRVDLGAGYSGPVVVGDLVISVETQQKKREVVRAFDRVSGRPVWTNGWEGAMSVPFFAKSNGDWIRSTPASDGTNLFVAGMRDVLVSLDVRTGAERWRYDFVKELGTPLPDFGFVCSPLIDGDAVYVQAGASLAKMDTKSGQPLWRSLQDKGGTFGSAFSSPVMAVLNGRRQLVVQTREKLAGVDPADGRVLWSQPVEAFRGMNILTPVIVGDSVFTSTYGGKTQLFRTERDGDNWRLESGWTHKSQGYMSTPVVVNGVVYEHLKSERVMALELKSGKELWTTDKSMGKYWSMVANGDRILALDQRGHLNLLRANPEKFDLMDQRPVSDADTWAHLAVAGDQLFVRELNGLSAWRWRATP